MEDKKIKIFILDEKEKKYSLEVEKIITYKSLKERVVLKFHKKDNFYIIFNKKTLNNNEDIISFNEGDIIYLIEYQDYQSEEEKEKSEEDKIYEKPREYLGKKRLKEKEYESEESEEYNIKKIKKSYKEKTKKFEKEVEEKEEIQLKEGRQKK